MKKILTIESFDPLEVDVSFLDEVSKNIPQEGFMDAAMAEQLATLTLKAANYCIDLLAQSTLFLGHCDSLRKAVKSKLIKTMMVNKVPSTLAKDAFADEPEYLEANNKYNMALAWSTWLENKYDALLKTHHLCKDLIRKNEGLRPLSDWTEANFQRASKNFSNSTESSQDESLTSTFSSSSSKLSPGKVGWKV